MLETPNAKVQPHAAPTQLSAAPHPGAACRLQRHVRRNCCTAMVYALCSRAASVLLSRSCTPLHVSSNGGVMCIGRVGAPPCSAAPRLPHQRWIRCSSRTVGRKDAKRRLSAESRRRRAAAVDVCSAQTPWRRSSAVQGSRCSAPSAARWRRTLSSSSAAPLGCCGRAAVEARAAQMRGRQSAVTREAAVLCCCSAACRLLSAREPTRAMGFSAR
jgi:hypothetical protein